MPDQYRFGYMQPNIRLSMGTPMEELEEWLKEMKGIHIGRKVIKVSLLANDMIAYKQL